MSIDMRFTNYSKLFLPGFMVVVGFTDVVAAVVDSSPNVIPITFIFSDVYRQIKFLTS